MMRMHGYTLSAVLEAFGCSLLIVKYFFEPAGDASRAASSPPSPAVVASAEGDVPSPALKTDERKPFKPLTIDRRLVASPEGYVNKNEKMGTTLYSEYARGASYFAGRGRQASIYYKPIKMAWLKGDEGLLETPLNISSKAELQTMGDTQRCVYRNTYPQVDEDMMIRTDGGNEHFWRIKNRPEGLDAADALAFVSTLQLSKGMSIWDGEQQIVGRHKTSGDLFFKGEDGQLLFQLRTPIAYDNHVTAADGSVNENAQENFVGSIQGCEYRLDVREDYVELAVATSSKWLNDPGRAYPVTIDPNIGPGGLTDAIYNGGQPIYIGAAGSGSFLGLHNGASGPSTVPCPMPAGVVYQLNVQDPDCGVTVMLMPFNFIYYRRLRRQGITPLFIYTDGLASFEPPPWPPGCPDNTYIPNPRVHNDAMYPYWDDLAFSSDPKSGIYVMMDGKVGNRRLIIEWYRMSFVRGQANERISFNLILYECNNQIEFIIRNSELGSGQLDEHAEIDRGEASVGIEDFTGSIGIQYDYNSSQAGGESQPGVPQPLPPITPETSVMFTPVVTTNITVTVDGNTVVPGQAYNPGTCLPVRSCFDAQLIVPDQNCGDNPSSVPPSYGFQWTLTLPNPAGGETLLAISKTQKFCYTFITPGSVNVTLDVIDGTGTKSRFGAFTYSVCDIPRVELSASPQGGLLPLTVSLHSESSASFVENIASTPADDYNTCPVNTRGLARGFVVVEPGLDELLHTRPAGDDELDLENQQILAGLNGINETTALNGSQVVVAGRWDQYDNDGVIDSPYTLAPAGDDQFVGINIVAMTDNICNTTAAAGDRQVVPVGASPDGAPGTPIWIIEKLYEKNLQSMPEFIATPPPGTSDLSFTFTHEGIYKVTAIWTAIDGLTGLPTVASYSIFIFTEDGNRPNDDNMIIEGSDLQVAWKGKKDRPYNYNDSDDNDLDPQNPDRDTIGFRGVFNLPHVAPTAVGSMPMRARVVLNGTLPIFDLGDGVLNPTGSLTVRDAFTGVQRTFKMDLPSGRFSVFARNLRLDEVLGLMNVTEHRLLPIHLTVELWDYSNPNHPVALYPQDPTTRGAMITCDYRSVMNGSAVGRYRLGDFTGDGFFVAVTPGQQGSTTYPPTQPTPHIINEGGQTVLVSGAFLVYQANLKLLGGNVVADIRGKVARFGGDFLSLQANSDVTVSIGPARDSQGNTLVIGASGFTETLNLSTSPKWSAAGGQKRRGPVYSFKRDPSLGQTGVKSIFLANRAGDFRILTHSLPNRNEGGLGGVGLDTTDITQVVPFELLITHEGDDGNSLQNLDARTEFLVTKTGKGSFQRK